MTALELLSKAESALRSQDIATAESLCRQALELEPEQIAVLNLLGMLLCQRGEHVEGVSRFRRMVELAPNDPALRCNLGVALQGAGSFHEAAEQLEAALALDPRHSVAKYNLGNIYREQGKLERAGELFRQAFELNPSFDGARINLASIHMQRGNIHMEQETPAEALACYQEALRLAHGHPNFPELYFSLGNANKALGNFEEALRWYERTIAVRPEFAEAHWNASQILLLQGDFERGWQEFEWRIKILPPFGWGRRTTWRGEDLRGKTVLLHAEQGYGDGIQFVRFAETLKKLGAARVIVECLPELSPLLLTAPGVDQLTLRGEPTPAFDYYLPIMSLPSVLKTALETLPRRPYLSPDPAGARAWYEKLRGYPGLKVGLVWAGSSWKEQPAANAVDRRRSLNLRQLLPLRDLRDVTFFNLQKGEPAEQMREVDFPMVDFISECRSFSDTAALVSNLDLVITVDSAMAHLTGAIGKPVWILSRFDGCWRWMMDRSDSPWYPSARIFRQKTPRNWEPVVDELAGALERQVGLTSI